MDTETQTNRTQGFIGDVFWCVALAAGIVLFAIMVLVAWAVFARYVLNAPILGGQELVEIGMGLVVMLAMPFATYSGAHIRVDILDTQIGNWGRFLGDLLARVLGAYVLSLLVRKTWNKALDAHEYGDVTNMIEIPVWIAYGSISIGMALVSVLLLGQALQQFREGVRGYV